MAFKHANIPDAAAKSTAHDNDDRLDAVAGGLLSSALGLCLTPVCKESYMSLPVYEVKGSNLQIEDEVCKHCILLCPHSVSSGKGHDPFFYRD
jgi:hypothetical protein